MHPTEPKSPIYSKERTPKTFASPDPVNESHSADHSISENEHDDIFSPSLKHGTPHIQDLHQPQCSVFFTDGDAMICCNSYSIPPSSLLNEFNSYSFIKYLPNHDDVLSKGYKVVLPKKNEEDTKPTLVLDLDETLVHCAIEPLPNCNLKFNVDFNGMNYVVYVKFRPYFKHFLQNVSKCYEVVIFTASQRAYAQQLLDLIDPDHTLISHRLYRDSCILVDGNYIKDLTILGRELKRTIIVDNSPHAFGYQVDNGIPIESWYDDTTDTELLTLLPYLVTLSKKDNVIPDLREKFKNYVKVMNAR